MKTDCQYIIKSGTPVKYGTLKLGLVLLYFSSQPCKQVNFCFTGLEQGVSFSAMPFLESYRKRL